MTSSPMDRLLYRTLPDDYKHSSKIFGVSVQFYTKERKFKRGHENLKKSCNSKMSLETHGKLKEFKKDMEFR